MLFFPRWYRNFLEDLRSLLSAGSPVREALESLSPRGAGTCSRLASSLLERVRAGDTLGEAMARFPRQVAPDHASLVELGERTGNLDRVLLRLVKRVDDRRAAASELAKAIAWPALTAVAAVVLLPLPLVVTGSGGLYIAIQAAFFTPLAILAIVAARGSLYCGRGSWWGALVEKVAFRVPLLRDVLLARAASRLFGLLGLLIETGGSIEESLEVAAGAMVWERFRLQVFLLPKSLRAGKTLGGALREAADLGLRPEWLARIEVGEQAGILDRVLQDLEAEIETRLARRTQYALRFLPAVIILLVGAAVLYQALSVFGAMGVGF